MAREGILVVVQGGALRPADAYAQEQIDILSGSNHTYVARLSKLTGPYREEREGLRGLWWAGCGLLAENSDTPGYLTKRGVSDMILTKLGMVRPSLRGKRIPEPVSLAENAGVDDEEFAIIMEMAQAFVVAKFGWNPWDEWKKQHPLPAMKK